MTDRTNLSAALLRDVPRYTKNSYPNTAENGYLMHSDDVLAALSRALDPALAERAGAYSDRLRSSCFLAFDDGTNDYGTAPLAADLLTALLAQNAALRAERDEALEWLSASQGYIADAVFALDKQEKAEAEVEKLRTETAFTATDGQRLLRKIDVIGVCDDPDLCFDSEGSVARCGPCAVKIAARDGVALNEYTRSNPQAMRLQRELSAAEAQIAALTARVERLTGALRDIEADCDADYPPSHGAIKQAARAALSATPTTEEGHE